MTAILTEFLGLLVGGISTLGTGIATGVENMAKALFVDTSTAGSPKLTTFGSIVAIFGGVALAVGITTAIFMWIRGIGR